MVAILGAIRFGWESFRSDPEAALPGLWGPHRTIYRCEFPDACQGADHVTFNSTVDTPNYGDERAFVDAKPASILEAGHFTDALDVQPGEKVLLRAYINNNAADPRRGVARDTTLRVEVPAEISEAVAPMVFVSASNSSPRTVWDGAWLRSEQPFRLEYVFGSASLWVQDCPPHGHDLHREVLSDNVVSDGVLIGTPRMNGRWPTPFCASALMTMRVRVLDV